MSNNSGSRLGKVASFFGGPVSTRVQCAIEKRDPEPAPEPEKKKRASAGGATRPKGPLGTKRTQPASAVNAVKAKKQKRAAARDFGDLDDEGDGEKKYKYKPIIKAKKPTPAKPEKSAKSGAAARPRAPQASSSAPRGKPAAPVAQARAPVAQARTSASTHVNQGNSASRAHSHAHAGSRAASGPGASRPGTVKAREGQRRPLAAGRPIASQRPAPPPQRRPAPPPRGYAGGYYDDDDGGDLDDFIVDDEDETAAAFRELRGMTRYQDFDDDFDDRSMEASAADIAREEARSARLGALDDREDIELERQMKLDKKRRKEAWLASQRKGRY